MKIYTWNIVFRCGDRQTVRAHTSIEALILASAVQIQKGHGFDAALLECPETGRTIEPNGKDRVIRLFLEANCPK